MIGIIISENVDNYGRPLNFRCLFFILHITKRNTNDFHIIHRYSSPLSPSSIPSIPEMEREPGLYQRSRHVDRYNTPSPSPSQQVKSFPDNRDLLR